MKVVEAKGRSREIGRVTAKALREELALFASQLGLAGGVSHPARRGTHPEGHVHCVNLYQSPALAEADRRKPAAKELAVRRRRMLDAKLAKGGRFDPEHMKALLRSHGQPTVCRHGGPDGSHTEYSLIGLPAQGRVLFRRGSPCAGAYGEVRV